MTGLSAANITIADVDRTIAGRFSWMRFPADIEARFEADTGRARHRHLIWAMLIGLVLYNTSLGADQTMLPDVFFEALLVKLGLVTPTVLIGAYALSRRPPVWLREAIVAATAVATSFAILFLILRSNALLAAHAHYSAILGVVFVNVILRARFWYACATSLVLLFGYTLSVIQLQHFAFEAVVSAVMLLVVTTIATLFANCSLERSERQAYLVRLREAIRNSHLTMANEELSRISNLDAMTGLTNRRGFDAHVGVVWEEARKSAESVAVLMIDVDFFKRFNDSNGHQGGDECLKEVAETARGELRRDDELIARYGGEEFVVLLPGADLVDGIRAGERIRRAIEGCGIGHQTAPLGVVTASIGVAAAPATSASTPQVLIEAADAALYEAKARGRNRVWPPIMSSGGEARPRPAAPHDDVAPLTHVA
jgi:diguanylate cyclase (GGDEF)-like protein